MRPAPVPFILKSDEWKPGEKIVYREEPEVQAARRAALGPRRRQDGAGRSGRMGLDSRSGDADQRADNGEVDWLRGAVASITCRWSRRPRASQLLPSSTRNQFTFRPNWLQPPFEQSEGAPGASPMRSTRRSSSRPVSATASIYRPCKAYSPATRRFASTAGTDGLIEGNVAKAQASCWRRRSYDGTPIVMLQPTDLGVAEADSRRWPRRSSRRSGFKVDIQPMDWQTHGLAPGAARRGRRRRAAGTPIGTSWSQLDILDPLMTPLPDRDLRQGPARAGRAMPSSRRCATSSPRPRPMPRRRPPPTRCRPMPCRSSPTSRSANGAASAVRANDRDARADAAGHGVLGLVKK